MIWLVTAQPDEIGLQAKKHLKICTEKIEWRTCLKIHSLVLSVEHKFMVLREFGRTTPQIHNHDMYDKWRETRLKVRMTKCCCKMVEATVYNKKLKSKAKTKWKKQRVRVRPSYLPTLQLGFEQLKGATNWHRNRRHEANKRSKNSMIETWNCFSSKQSRGGQRAACWFDCVINDKILPNLQMSIDKQQNGHFCRQRMKDRNRALALRI